MGKFYILFPVTLYGVRHVRKNKTERKLYRNIDRKRYKNGVHW